MIQGIQSALAGLRAATQRVGIAAENIANARSAGALHPYGGYVPQEAVQSVSAVGTPVVASRPVAPAHVVAYAPEHPDADADGLIGQPNVDMARNLVELSLAENSYRASLATLHAADEMSQALYDEEA